MAEPDDKHEYLLQKLRELRQEEGRSPTTEDLEKAEGFPDLSEYISEFGYWNDAKEEAGLKTRAGGPVNEKGPPRKYSREELLTKLEELDEHLDHDVRQEDMDWEEGYPSVTVYRQRFGSWEEAKKKAGLESSQKDYSDEELLDFLKEKSEEVEGRPLRTRDIEEDDDMPHPSIYYHRFESFESAKEQAGVQYDLSSKEDSSTQDSEEGNNQ